MGLQSLQVLGQQTSSKLKSVWWIGTLLSGMLESQHSSRRCLYIPSRMLFPDIAWASAVDLASRDMWWFRKMVGSLLQGASDKNCTRRGIIGWCCPACHMGTSIHGDHCNLVCHDFLMHRRQTNRNPQKCREVVGHKAGWEWEVGKLRVRVLPFMGSSVSTQDNLAHQKLYYVRQSLT